MSYFRGEYEIYIVMSRSGRSQSRSPSSGVPTKNFLFGFAKSLRIPRFLMTEACGATVAKGASLPHLEFIAFPVGGANLNLRRDLGYS